MTTTVMLACLLLGQSSADPSFPSSITLPGGTPMRQVEAPPPLGSAIGEPTPADPREAPLFLEPRAATPLPDDALGSSVLPASQPTFALPVQQASAVLPATSTTTAATPAHKLLDETFPTDRQATTAEQSLRLRELVAAASEPAQRMAAIRTYWEAATLWADWQFAHEELELLTQLPNSGDAAAQAKLQAARASATARVIEAQMAVASAQWALAEIVGAPGGQPPLPVDRPLVGSYTTHFETLFAGRPAPPSVRRIHGILPLRHQLVEARAAAVEASRNSLGEQMRIGGDERGRLAQTLAALDELRRQRGAFLGAVRDYNLEIAEYAMAVAQPDDPPEKIVAMLIEVKRAAAVAQLAQQPSRSVLVSSPGGVTPASVLTPPTPPTPPVFSAPGQVSIQAQGPAPLLPALQPPINAPAEAPSEAIRPRSIFSNPADATPALPPARP